MLQDLRTDGPGLYLGLAHLHLCPTTHEMYPPESFTIFATQKNVFDYMPFNTVFKIPAQSSSACKGGCPLCVPGCKEGGPRPLP